MNEQQEKLQQQQDGRRMSDFCEALMDATAMIGKSHPLTDAAIVICSDGKGVASRQCGLYPDALRMLYTKMRNDDKFAELIMEASRLYSRHVLGKKVPTFPTIVKPIKQTQS